MDSNGASPINTDSKMEGARHAGLNVCVCGVMVILMVVMTAMLGDDDALMKLLPMIENESRQKNKERKNERKNEKSTAANFAFRFVTARVKHAQTREVLVVVIACSVEFVSSDVAMDDDEEQGQLLVELDLSAVRRSRFRFLCVMISILLT